MCGEVWVFFFSSRRRHTRLTCDWSSDVCSSDLLSSGIELAVRAGVDFPYLIYQWANEEPIDRIEEYRSGVRMRYLEGDLLTTLQTFAQRGRPGVTADRKSVV